MKSCSIGLVVYVGSATSTGRSMTAALTLLTGAEVLIKLSLYYGAAEAALLPISACLADTFSLNTCLTSTSSCIYLSSLSCGQPLAAPLSLSLLPSSLPPPTLADGERSGRPACLSHCFCVSNTLLLSSWMAPTSMSKVTNSDLVLKETRSWCGDKKKKKKNTRAVCQRVFP